MITLLKYYPLVWAALWRKPVRTILTSLSIIVAFLIFGVLQGVNARLGKIVAEARLDRLTTVARFPTGLPMADLEQIARVPGVTTVAPADGMSAWFQKPENRVSVFMVDERYFQLNPIEPRAAAEALLANRTGALISDRMAETYGWKEGDRVPLQSRLARKDGAPAWEFEIVAIGRDFDQSRGRGYFFVNRSYIDEARAVGAGTANMFMIATEDPSRAVETSAAIDALFANSAAPTKTQSDRMNAENEMEMIVDIGLVTNGVVGVVIFVLAFITSNTMAQSVRERLPEFAVLKTIGFTDDEVLWLTLAEALTLAVGGALVGLAAARVLMANLPDPNGALYGIWRMPIPVIFIGVGMSVLLAVVSGISPGWRVRRLVVVDALAGR